MRPPRLTPDEIDAMRQACKDWQVSDDGRAITLDLKFTTFRRAIAFMNEMALAAEKFDHHPEWSNVYNRVSIRLTTHDVGGLTVLDETMARLMSEAAGRFEAVRQGKAS